MATPNSKPSAPKTISSRLLTMKFMQRAAASSPTSASNITSPTTPDEPSAKRRKATDGSPQGKGFDVDALADSRAIQKALEEEETKRQLALEKQGLEAGDTRWVLSFEGSGEDRKEGRSLRVVQTGWANLDTDTGLGQGWKVERDEGEEDEEGDGNKPAVVGRRSFGKFNRVLEKQQDPSQEDTQSDSEEEVKDETEFDDDYDHDPTKSLLKESREAVVKQLKAERKAKRRAERAESVDLAKKRKKKEVKLNSAGLTSLTGRQDWQDSPKACHMCGGPHLKAQCPQITNENKRHYQGEDDGPARKTIRSETLLVVKRSHSSMQPPKPPNPLERIDAAYCFGTRTTYQHKSFVPATSHSVHHLTRLPLLLVLLLVLLLHPTGYPVFIPILSLADGAFGNDQHPRYIAGAVRGYHSPRPSTQQKLIDSRLAHCCPQLRQRTLPFKLTGVQQLQLQQQLQLLRQPPPLNILTQNRVIALVSNSVRPGHTPYPSLRAKSLPLANFSTMATLSQPQTPANLDSPLREHRHRPVERLTDRLETPSLDDRSYRVIRLDSQLEVLLVHDQDTDKASAAMDVNVGNFSDPEDLPGLAHCVEHMLFMGTKKYPVENAYSQYLSSHSGSSNAYTDATSTNYYFEVAAKNSEDAAPDEASPLYGALDRFAQFFIDPLFLSSTLDRELRAVDSENKKNLQSDQWRMHQLDKSLSNPNHPYCHFSTGNLEVLKTEPEARGINVRQKFMEFHEKHYSANRMKLVVLGCESLDVLEEWTAELFAGVRNKDLPQNRWEDEEPLRKEELLTQCFAKPVMDSRELELSFPFIDEELLFESQPSRYISHLIGHEGPGSIMSYIKAKGWANGLSAGAYPVCPGTPSIFNVQVRLTEDGLKNYIEVVKVLFQYISLLKDTPPQEWIFEEQKGLADVDFRFKQKTPASRFTSKISAVMQTPLPREWLLSGHSRLRKFDAARIEEGLACLRPDNFRMSIVSQNFPGEWPEKEKWYGTEYKYEKIPAELLEEIKKAGASTIKNRLSELHLPHENQFIPKKLEVEKRDVKEPAIAPKLIRNDDHVRTWFKKDDTFWVPKANLFINCRNPLPAATAENSLKAKLYSDIVRDALEEYSYDAELAGLDYSVSSHSSGFEIAISGYNDKLSVLLEKVLITMRDLEVKPERFEIIKERLLRGLKNWDFQQPYNQVGDFTRWLTSERSFINDQILAELHHLTAADIQQFFPQLLRQMHIETFMHGNLYKEDALTVTDMIENLLKPRILPQNQWPISRTLIFPPGANYVYHKTLKDPANVNHCIEYFLYIGTAPNRPLRAKTLLFDQMTHEPAFDQLRTKEQLGYVVFSGSRSTGTSIGYRFIIQSEKTPDYLESRIDSFLVGYTEILKEMSDSEFEGHKRSVIAKRLEKLKNLDQESGRLWSHIDNEFLDFELVHHDAAQIKALTKADMIEYFSHYIHPSSPARAKLSVHLIAQASSTETETETEPSGVTAVLEKSMKALGVKQDKQSDEDEEVVLTKVEGNGTEPVAITDVRDFKAKLQVSAGPSPVKHISEFEELDSKL
ncbi:hypothetical protein B7494_g3941 [Chlorociboria aeruginascens]|nr:hypothetical protein B7494_g3941 [Chlorociboria aeruginascens]